MIKIINNNNLIKENKNYYKNILVKIKNKNKIISIHCTISYSNNNYKLITTFSKIYSFKTNISLEYINKILTFIFPNDIIYKILIFYLKNDISFINNRKKNIFTNKIITNINYNDYLNLYKINKNKEIKTNYEDNKNIELILSKNYENLLNKNKNFNIDHIFNKQLIDMFNNKIEYSILYKIYNTNIGWGINI